MESLAINNIKFDLPDFFRQAKAISSESDHPKHQCGAALFKKNKILSSGRNYHQKTHPILLDHDITGHKTQHAEVSCVVKIKNKEILFGSTIVVFRENKHGVPSMVRPCPMCQSILRSFGVKKMIYTTNGGWAEEYL